MLNLLVLLMFTRLRKHDTVHPIGPRGWRFRIVVIAMAVIISIAFTFPALPLCCFLSLVSLTGRLILAVPLA